MKFSKLSAYKLNKLIDLFVTGHTARAAAEISGINSNSTTYFFQRLRRLISSDITKQNKRYARLNMTSIENKLLLSNQIHPIFFIVRDGHRLTTHIIPQFNQSLWMMFFMMKNDIEAIFYSNGRYIHNTYNISEFNCLCFNTSDQKEMKPQCISEIDNFWQFSKNHLSKFNGIPVESFDLYLKECEWRYRYKHDDELKTKIRNLMGQGKETNYE